MLLHVHYADKNENMTSPERVLVMKGPASTGNVTTAEWTYQYTGLASAFCLLYAQRIQELTQQGDGPTVYRTSEHFTGCLKCCAGTPRVTVGFQTQGNDLKKRAEAMYQQQQAAGAAQ